MTASIISTQPIDFTGQQRDNHLPQCRLLWRQGQLLVRLSQDIQQLYLPPLESEQDLVRCLKHSPVRLVRIDATLGETMLKRWANACEQVGKPMFLRGTVTQKLKGKHSKLIWCLMRLIDAIAALLLLTLLSSVMLAIALIIYVYSPGWLFSLSWQVGTRGKLFRAIKFRTTPANDDSWTTPLGRWMCKYSLDELPQLFNVLRGEMSLVRPHSLSLSKAVRLSFNSDSGTRLDWSRLGLHYPLMPE